MNKKLLNDKIKENGVKRVKLKEIMNCSSPTLKKKLDGEEDFTVSEMNAIKNFLHLSEDEVNKIFMDNEVHKILNE